MGGNETKKGFLNKIFEYFVCIFWQILNIDKIEASRKTNSKNCLSDLILGIPAWPNIRKNIPYFMTAKNCYKLVHEAHRFWHLQRDILYNMQQRFSHPNLLCPCRNFLHYNILTKQLQPFVMYIPHTVSVHWNCSARPHEQIMAGKFQL